jgi:uncharacterized peroxidase-related enzyme
MPFFRSLSEKAGPPNVFKAYPDLYRLWSEMSEILMNGPSPLSQAERELLFAYTAGVAGCAFVYIAHSEVAHAWGVEEGLVEKLVADLDGTPVDPKMKPLLAFVRKLTLSSSNMTQADADAVFDAGWDEKALHDAIAVTGRMRYMQCIAEGYGFTPMTKDVARHHAERRVKLGYVYLYPMFGGKTETSS